MNLKFRLKVKWNPITAQRIKRFKAQTLAVNSLKLLVLALGLSLAAPLITNHRPYVMKWQGKWYFPLVREPTGADLGQPDTFLVDYKKLEFKGDDWALFAPVRFDPLVSNEGVSQYPSRPSRENPLGTDDRGRDVLSRLLHGFRYSFLFGVATWMLTYLVGVSAGLAMGFFGGRVDFVGQRVVEVLSSVPQFFLLITLISVFEPSLGLLVSVTAAFGWISISYYARAEALRLRGLEFVDGARALGLSSWKILFRHVLPNALTPVVTFSPFAIAGGITGLAALDYLGFGLPAPTPSWGELLNQARKSFTTAWWLALFPSFALFSTLTLLNFVGEGLREAWDPKGRS